MSNVQLPWLEEAVEVEEAVELVAHADANDEAELRELRDHVERLERRIRGLEDGSWITCPSCDGDESVYKAGVGAAKLASDGALSDANAEALNGESHVCLECQESFTPPVE